MLNMYTRFRIIYRRTRLPLRTLLIILIIWAIKEAITRLVWSCPCLTYTNNDWWSTNNARQLYGIFFVLMPSIAFWIIGIFLQENTWRCITGWRIQDKFAYPGRSCCCFFWTLGATSLAPIAWIFFVLIDGRYLECIEATIPEVCQVPGVIDPQTAKIYVISQVTAIIVAVGSLLCFTLVRILSACCGSMTYYQLRHAQHIRELEEETFYKASQEYHTNELKKKWKTLFAAGSLSDWNAVSELVPNDPIKRTKHTHYTPFQNWNGIVAPDSTIRLNNFGDYNDTNTVTVVVKSNDGNAHMDVNKSGDPNGDIWTGGKHINDGRGLPIIPHPAMPPMTYGGYHPSGMDINGSVNRTADALYPTLSGSREADKYSLMPYDEVLRSHSTSTPKVKKKKTNKKKNKVDDTQ